ncbi:MAG: BrnT family toxin [Polaromonas sp.]
MKIEFDVSKNDRNIRERSLSFERVADFDFETSRIWQDTRKPYPEERFLALGYLDNRLHVLCFIRLKNGIRVISFRKANQREGEKHGFALTCD